MFVRGKLFYTVGYYGNKTHPQETCQIVMQRLKQSMLNNALVLVFCVFIHSREISLKVSKTAGFMLSSQ